MTILQSVELRGAQRPRVCSVPPYRTSSGVEAVELAASAGLVLDPWQAFILEDALGERADGKWSAFEVAAIVPRQNGKGGITEARELAGLFLFGERLILHSAHEFKTAAEAFLRVKALVDNTDDLRRRVARVRTGTGTESIELLNGARLRFVARSKGSGRGFTGDCVILDEAYALTDEEMAALMPTLSARPNAQIWYTSTPPTDSAALLLRLRRRGEAGAGDLAYFDFGAAGQADEIDLDDRRVWAATNPALGIRISEETIAREREVLSDEDFARERLGVWPRNAAGGVIDPKQWADAGDPESKRAGDVAVAVDIAPDRDRAWVAVYGLRGDGLGHVQLVDDRPGTDWIIGRVVELRAALDPLAFAMGRGTGASLETDLAKVGITRSEDPDEPKRGDLVVANASDMAAACGQLIDAVRQGVLRHVPQPALDAAVAGAKTRQTGDTIAWSRKDTGGAVGPLVAVTLARWAFVSRAHLVTADYDVLDSVF